jgi:hypothetical protein
LKVLSTNDNDVGIKYLDLVATSSTKKSTLRVKVIFTSKLSIDNSEQASSISKPLLISEPEENS